MSRLSVRSTSMVLTGFFSVAALIGSAVAPAQASAQQATVASVAASDSGGTGTAAVPRLGWSECGPDFGESRGPRWVRFDCTRATVPLDYDSPRGPQIQVALKRVRTVEETAKIGTLFINPGGPGGSGVDFASFAWALFPKSILNRFDIVGFDPRGVARSNALVCFSSFQELDTVFAGTEPFPVTTAQYRKLGRAFSVYGSKCDRTGSSIIDHMSTADTARDMDLLRRAVGDDKLTYAGYSYGSQLGTTYANLFPGKVRALVVDGVLDPIAWTTGAAGDQALPYSARLRSDAGASKALGKFFSLCGEVGPDRCLLDRFGDAQDITTRTLAELKKAPVRVDFGDGFVLEFTYQSMVTEMLGILYGSYFWDFLAQDLSLVADAAGVIELPKATRARLANPAAAQRLQAAATPSAKGGSPMPQTLEGFDGVACSDSDNPSGSAAWWAAGKARDRVAPYFGSLWTWASGACANWPGAAKDRYTGPWTKRTAGPVLVVGNTYDPATAYTGAQKVASLLPNSTLLTLDGYGHTSLGASRCTETFVTRFLVNASLPPAGIRCAPDTGPFDNAFFPSGAGKSSEAAQRATAVSGARAVITSGLPGGGVTGVR